MKRNPTVEAFVRIVRQFGARWRPISLTDGYVMRRGRAAIPVHIELEDCPQPYVFPKVGQVHVWQRERDVFQSLGAPV